MVSIYIYIVARRRKREATTRAQTSEQLCVYILDLNVYVCTCVYIQRDDPRADI